MFYHKVERKKQPTNQTNMNRVGGAREYPHTHKQIKPKLKDLLICVVYLHRVCETQEHTMRAYKATL